MTDQTYSQAYIDAMHDHVEQVQEESNEAYGHYCEAKQEVEDLKAEKAATLKVLEALVDLSGLFAPAYPVATLQDIHKALQDPYHTYWTPEQQAARPPIHDLYDSFTSAVRQAL